MKSRRQTCIRGLPSYGSDVKRFSFSVAVVAAVIACVVIPRMRETPKGSAASAFRADGRPKARVLILGDSIAAGYTIGDSVSTGYAPLVQGMMSDRAVVLWPAGADGTAENCCGTKFGLQHIDRLLQTGGGKWDVIHFNWGLHDVKHEGADGKPSELATDPPQAAVEIYESQLRALTAKMKATGAKLIFATSTPVPEGKLKPWRSDADVVRYNAAALRVMRENAIAVDDLYAFMKPKAAALQLPENVHFNAEGCAALATEVARSIGAEVK